MEGRDEGIMHGRTQISCTAGAFSAEIRQSGGITAPKEAVAEGSVACLGETRGIS
jgi:hypothetical protein